MLFDPRVYLFKLLGDGGVLLLQFLGGDGGLVLYGLNLFQFVEVPRIAPRILHHFHLLPGTLVLLLKVLYLLLTPRHLLAQTVPALDLLLNTPEQLPLPLLPTIHLLYSHIPLSSQPLDLLFHHRNGVLPGTDILLNIHEVFRVRDPSFSFCDSLQFFFEPSDLSDAGDVFVLVEGGGLGIVSLGLGLEERVGKLFGSSEGEGQGGSGSGCLRLQVRFGDGEPLFVEAVSHWVIKYKGDRCSNELYSAVGWGILTGYSLLIHNSSLVDFLLHPLSLRYLRLPSLPSSSLPNHYHLPLLPINPSPPTPSIIPCNIFITKMSKSLILQALKKQVLQLKSQLNNLQHRHPLCTSTKPRSSSRYKSISPRFDSNHFDSSLISDAGVKRFHHRSQHSRNLSELIQNKSVCEKVPSLSKYRRAEIRQTKQNFNSKVETVKQKNYVPQNPLTGQGYKSKNQGLKIVSYSPQPVTKELGKKHFFK